MKILLADDDSLMLKTIEYRLKKDGFEVIPCLDGNEAFEKIASENPDIIVTDIMMPFVTGLELVDKTRNELKKDTPIIVLSGVGLEKTVLEAFELGADDFISKPFSPSELVVRINRLSRKK